MQEDPGKAQGEYCGKVKASLTEHLKELRRRLISVLSVFAIAAILSYPISPSLLSRAKADLLGDLDLVVLGPQEALMIYVKVSVLLGFAFTMPVLTYHVWAFISPGLLKKEKEFIAYLVLPSALLFASGLLFGYYALLPVALKFLIASAQPLATPMLSLDHTFTFIVSILLALGVIFQLPLVTAALARLGLLDSRALSRYRRHSIVVILLVSAMVTDPSVVTQLLLAVPMIILYEVGIFTSKLAGGNG
ncbi:MAG: twin-arginine translocase subunit TatC [Candidatus Altiarchaeales archaeon]|nr:twin-arginine translocase subunit TatC [Candidatus Altiarchaeales archaeon]MBD3417233.1 twin-arginine translocase subunit TatC [Candidatus Altiarchaeales archaeon]